MIQYKKVTTLQWIVCRVLASGFCVATVSVGAQDVPLINPSAARPQVPLTIMQKTMQLPPSMPSGPILMDSAAQSVQIIGSLFNQLVIQDKVKSQWTDAFADGASEARRLGQKGFLIRVEVMTEPVESGDFLSLRGGQGVTLMGVGPDAGAVCLAASCFDRLVPKASSVQDYAPASSYYWVKETTNSFVAHRYGLRDLESRTSQISFDADMRKSIKEVNEWEALSDYSDKLEKNTKNKEDSKAVVALINSRNDAAENYQKIERELVAELAKAKKATETSNNIRAFADIVTVSTAINTVRVNLGDDVAKSVEGSKTNDQIATRLDEISKRSSVMIQSLINGRVKVQDDLSKVKGTILKLGNQNDMTPKISTPLLR